MKNRKKYQHNYYLSRKDELLKKRKSYYLENKEDLLRKQKDKRQELSEIQKGLKCSLYREQLKEKLRALLSALEANSTAEILTK